MPTLQPPMIHGAGRSEAEWASSDWLSALPVRPSDVLLRARRLLVVSPHPDDEVLGCGGLIRTAVRAGLPVRVVSVTHGEACYPDDPQWPPARLRRVRSAELVAALAELGAAADSLLELSLPDGDVAGHEAMLADRLNGIIGEGDHVLTTWRHDGHPDHEATARATRLAAADCGASLGEFPIWAWHWMSAEQSHSPLGKAYRIMFDKDVWKAKQAAIKCFASQCAASPDGTREPILPPRVLARFQRPYEVFLP